MVEVYVLIQGVKGKSEIATTSLVLDNNIKMVVDPTVLRTQKTLLDKLEEHNLSVDDINYAFITHGHMDHFRNLGMFPDTTKVIDYLGEWNRDEVDDYDFDFTKNIKIIKTPGHTYDSISLLVETKQGIIGICGDVFWDENGPDFDKYAQNMKKLKQSRKKLLELCDYILPGHGEMFKVEK